MNLEESYQILALLQANYPDTFRGMSDEAAKVKIQLWADMFADYPFDAVAAASKAFMATDTKGFMPTVGQIMEQIQKMRHGGDEMTPAEAWARVSLALRNSTYASAEEFEKLPPELKRAVGSPSQLREWAMMDTETVQSVIGSTFQRSFQIRQNRDRDMKKLPGAVRKFISGVAENCIGKLPEAEEDSYGEL